MRAALGQAPDASAPERVRQPGDQWRLRPNCHQTNAVVGTPVDNLLRRSN